LSYFIVPFFLYGQYRNFSVWDPIWKFDSWGLKQIVIWFLNGDLFDFGRLPILTYAVIFGLLKGIGKLLDERRDIFPYLCMLFLVYSILFLGRTTLGGLIDLIPGFSEYHLHRIVVMVQFVGLYVGTWFVYSIIKQLDIIFFTLSGSPVRRTSDDIPKKLKIGIFAALVLLTPFLLYYFEKPVMKYAQENNDMIVKSNKAYQIDLPHYGRIKAKLNALPRARLYVGKPGNWGRLFTVGQTPVYMALSQDGYSVIGFLPESWSPNSDPEQFFNENNLDFYKLYNVGYSILPDTVTPPSFAKLVVKEGKYSLYKMPLEGWFTVGKSTVLVRSKKTDLLTMTRLWFGSNFLREGNYPTIELKKSVSKIPSSNWVDTRWQIQITESNNYVNLNDRIERNIWNADPFNKTHTVVLPTGIQKLSEETLPNGYKARLMIKEECKGCILILKQSFHPNWQVKINGQRVNSFPVFPFYIGIPLKNQGSINIVATYKVNPLKIVLVGVALIGVGGYFIRFFLAQTK
ncbi:hypothetical protein HYW87_03315, partial [Candidatus Roizmanbacteria bacterium]|nr:hypothetical protein [Candidatus Roizmanbacteria bacterium]